jgi:hypothetical protein
MGFFKEVMSENSREETLKEGQKGIDLYCPYDKPTILPGEFYSKWSAMREPLNTLPNQATIHFRDGTSRIATLTDLSISVFLDHWSMYLQNICFCRF